MNYPKISIVTPSLNQGKYIRKTIESVLAQNYPHLEYIIIDGGSTDATLEILETFKDKIYWVSEKDQGQADAINKGFALASGEILAFINSDDCYLPNVLHQVAREFLRNGCLWLTGDYRIIDSDSMEIQPLVVGYKKFWRKFSSRNVLSMLNYMIQPSTFWHRDLWNFTGPFDVSLRYAFDYDFWMRAMKKEMPLILDQPLSLFRVHKSSKGGSQYQKQFDEEIQVMRRYNRHLAIGFFHVLHNHLIKFVYRLIK